MPNAVLERVATAVQDYQKLRNSLNGSLVINGKSLKEWHQIFFRIRIPQDADPIVCKQLSLKILYLNQLASSYYTMANARFAAIQSSNEWLCRDKYQEIARTYSSTQQKMPAAAFLETMAKAGTENVRALVTIAEVEKSFWKDILNYITRMRKQLENVAMNNALMYKAEGYTGISHNAVSQQDGNERIEDDEDDDDLFLDTDSDDTNEDDEQ